MTFEELLTKYRYIEIKGLNAKIEYDFCSSKYTVRLGFWNRIAYRGADFKEAFNTFFENIRDNTYG